MIRCLYQNAFHVQINPKTINFGLFLLFVEFQEKIKALRIESNKHILRFDWIDVCIHIFFISEFIFCFHFVRCVNVFLNNTIEAWNVNEISWIPLWLLIFFPLLYVHFTRTFRKRCLHVNLCKAMRLHLRFVTIWFDFLVSSWEHEHCDKGKTKLFLRVIVRWFFNSKKCLFFDYSLQ